MRRSFRKRKEHRTKSAVLEGKKYLLSGRVFWRKGVEPERRPRKGGIDSRRGEKVPFKWGVSSDREMALNGKIIRGSVTRGKRRVSDCGEESTSR